MKRVKTILSELNNEGGIIAQGRKNGVQYVRRLPKTTRILFYDEYIPARVKVEEQSVCIGIKETRTGVIYKSIEDIPHRLKFKPRKKGPGRKPKSPLQCVYSTIKKELHIPASIVGKAFDEYVFVTGRGGRSVDKFKYANKVVKFIQYEYDEVNDCNTIKLVISR